MQTFTLEAGDDSTIHGLRWLPEGAPRGVVVISHGMSEYAERYAPLAASLAAAGYAVYAHDHRGHGRYAPVPGWFAARGGWELVVDDVRCVVDYARSQHDCPLVLYGHSMGSFIARSFLLRYGQRLDGLVLSATGYRQHWLARLMRQVARLAGRLGGATSPSPFMTSLVFGSFNLGFVPARTRLDWLSRDAAAVDAYIADPLCGHHPTPQLWQDLFGGIIVMEAGEADGKSLPAACPVWLQAGSRDPVSLGKLGLGQLAARYRRAGLRDVTVTVYRGGRHEMHNETNRGEFEADLLAWLNRVTSR
ncbi:alpha/beta fold hydrolase [Vogesella sp. LIG4]|uniref:alpha/beta fold hydrolase n=1 Tax=Vogesella sp. LIG4 TaxID=1192162 RepID=UPI00081FDC07|nr:alpha/beta hydrolase [Vogesella sp. LIG4]SCK10557.1 Lysophospholipase, alpha-beta hydrolase superfamily [Vogesella sp. LIG4]